MNKMYAFADAEFFRAASGLRGEERTHVDSSPRNAMIPARAEHLARAAAEVQNSVSGFMRSTRPSVAYFSSVNGLWMRCSLSLMVKYVEYPLVNSCYWVKH